MKAPKLYLHDTGLPCWLLGIRDSESLRHHALCGAVFESWVASEIVKARRNRGLQPDLLHYRDRGGMEVDLVLERGDRRRKVESLVIYGGNERQARESGRLMPWRAVDEVDWC
ncbi:MAG: DUF4143 domain-containing protein [Planctomycetes bacterium]|nr:DUF4143 domain-containing protein [Planctomycetota bacterium]